MIRKRDLLKRIEQLEAVINDHEAPFDALYMGLIPTGKVTRRRITGLKTKIDLLLKHLGLECVYEEGEGGKHIIRPIKCLKFFRYNAPILAPCKKRGGEKG